MIKDIVVCRRFNFFDKEIVKNVSTNQELDYFKDVNITCSTYGQNSMIIGDSDGVIRIISLAMLFTRTQEQNSGDSLFSFKAYHLSINFIYQLKHSSILITVGEDEPGVNPLIKVWNLDKIEKESPVCTRISRALCNNNIVSQVTCIAVHENLNYMAIGFSNGKVVLYKGDVTKDRHSKQRVIYEQTRPMTSLVFRSTVLRDSSIVLFATTPSNVISITIPTRGKDIILHTLDDKGCEQNCSTEMLPLNEFVVARKDALYFYEIDERGQCLAFDGEKLSVTYFCGYLIVIGREVKSRNLTGSDNDPLEIFTVTLYDVRNKFIAYSCPIQSKVKAVICVCSSIYLICDDGKLYRLLEKDTVSKLNTLFKKNLYQVAITLAKTQNYDSDGVIDIHRQYGDHLYNKGDHSGAVLQYIETIGRLEPSYVICKFLDASRIHDLTAYLEALHTAKQATCDHTTLLLNCCTKLQDDKKLDDFITNQSKDDVINFDVGTALRVCRQAGYFKHAVYLAQHQNRHDWYIKIQIEDLNNFAMSLDYIAKLPFKEAEENLKQYGKLLLNAEPEKTTKLLMSLCNNYIRTNDEPSEEGIEKESANPEEFIHIFVDNLGKLSEFLEYIIKVRSDCSSVVYNTLLDLYLHSYNHEKDIKERVNKERKILDLLQNLESCYDADHLLVLCQSHNFKAGILYLYEMSCAYEQILQYHIQHNSPLHILETCTSFGDNQSNLWIQALSYFATREHDCAKELNRVLDEIDRRCLMSHLSIIQVLSDNNTTSLGVIKQYLCRKLKEQAQMIQQDKELIENYRKDTDTMRQEIDEMKSTAKIFQASKCLICNHILELPSIHFLCEHSYHQHCYESYSSSEGNESECPSCIPENKKLQVLLSGQQYNSKNLDDEFHSLLEKSQDPFSIVADYFARNIFNKMTILMDPIARPRTKSKVFSSKKEAILESNKKVVISADVTTNYDRGVRLPSRPAISLNPFEDKSPTNPFASTDASVKVDTTTKDRSKSSNPFDDNDDYDSNLNPFS